MKISVSWLFLDSLAFVLLTNGTKQVYRLFCRRLSILASNMRLGGLSIAIARACAVAEEILFADAEPVATTAAIPKGNPKLITDADSTSVR